MDNKFRASQDDVSLIVDKYSKSYEHLGFFKKQVKVVDQAPNNNPISKPEKKVDLSDMSGEELFAYAKKKFK